MPKRILCPYYKRIKSATKHSPDRVICECGTIRFRDSQMRKDLIYCYCALDYQSCQLYKILTAYHNRSSTPKPE